MQGELAQRMAATPDSHNIILPIGVNVNARNNGRDAANGLRLLAVSSLTPVKNNQLMLRALQKLPEHVTLNLVGDGPLHESLENLAQKLGLGDRVVFHGWVHHQEMPRVYQQADVFVQTSWHEGEGLAIQEAMAAGLPVVSSRVGIATDVVVSGANGFLFEPGNLDELVSALRQLVGDLEYRQGAGIASWKIALEKLGRPIHVARLVELYRKTVRDTNGHFVQS